MKKLSWLFLILFISSACQSSPEENNQETSTIGEEISEANLPKKREGYLYLDIPFELKGNNSIEEKLKEAKAIGFKKGEKAILVTKEQIEVMLICTEMDVNRIEFQATVLSEEGDPLGELVDVIYHGRRGDAENTFSFNSSIKVTHKEILWQCNFEKESDFGKEDGTWTKHLLITKEGIKEGVTAHTEKKIPEGFIELKSPFSFSGEAGPTKTSEQLEAMGLKILSMGNPNPINGLLKTANGTLLAIAASETMSMGNYELSFYVVDASGQKIGGEHSTFIFSAASDGYMNADVNIKENTIEVRSKEYKGKSIVSEKTKTYQITAQGVLR